MIVKKLSYFIVFELILFMVCFGAFSSESIEKSFLDKEMKWRAKRDLQMRAPTSWLSIAGLYWLQEGENSYGTDQTCAVRLPPNTAPGQAGNFILEEKEVYLTVKPGLEVKVNGKAAARKKLKSDEKGRPDVVEIRDLRLWVIKRGDRTAIRLRDLNHSPYREYKKLDYFPPDSKYKIMADFTPFPELKTIKVLTMIGTQTEMTVVGTARFILNGQDLRLSAFGNSLEPDTLFFIFKDRTNGIETYEASRFMTAEVLEAGKVDLNFNRAYNPPCAYTPFATCPLPPPENHLDVRIEAGEKKYSGIEHK